MIASLHLPTAGTSTETLLADYAKPLIAMLREQDGASGIVAGMESAETSLRNVLHARELAHRLIVRADARGDAAEAVTEKEILALFDVLKRDGGAQRAVFPNSLGASLAPRGQGQVDEMRRLLANIADLPSAPPGAASVTARLAEAATELSERCAVSAATHASFVDLVAAEHHEQRAFRRRYHDACGALVALLPHDAERLSQVFGDEPQADLLVAEVEQAR